MLRRAFVLLLGALAVTGCGGQSGRQTGSYQPLPAPVAANQPVVTAAPNRVAILLPLTGPRADVGQALLQAARLALATPGSPVLDVRDTAGSPDSAAIAARSAIAEGSRLILGPLTSAETASVAPVARNAGVPVLAFTNDAAQTQPGVWVMGITPVQQIRRLVAAAAAQGKTEFAALLPDNDFGRALSTALQQATALAGLSEADIHIHTPGMSGITGATRELSDYGNRRGPVDAQIKAARALGTAEGRRQAAELAKTQIPPPKFNVLLLGDTGDELAGIAAVLPYYDIDRHAVQIIGPALWASPNSGAGELPGAWYAAPDPASREGFEQDYVSRFNVRPLPLADLAFDAASIARLSAEGGGISVRGMTQPAGFQLADGWIGLLPDGQVRRGLAVFRIERGGPAMIEPAPQSASAPGS